MQKLTFSELAIKLREANAKNISLVGVVVFKEENWKESYTLEERSYAISSSNKYFTSGAGGNSIFGSDLAGIDRCVRLDYYMFHQSPSKLNWKVDYCYIKED